MPRMPFSELFTFKSRSEMDNVILHAEGWTLKYKTGPYGPTPNYDSRVIKAQMTRFLYWEPKSDVRVFFEKDGILSFANGITAIYATFKAGSFFRQGTWPFLLCATPVFLAPYFLSLYDQTVNVTHDILMGESLRCPLCVVNRGGVGMALTSSFTAISVSFLSSYLVSLAFRTGRTVPPPHHFKALFNMGKDFMTTHRIPISASIATNFVFGCWLAYLQVSSYYNIHKVDVMNYEKEEWKIERGKRRQNASS